MAAGNINERQIDLRSDSTSNYGSLKDYFDSVQINATDAKYQATVSAGFSVLDSSEVSDAPDGILPLTPGVHVSITSTDNLGLHGGVVAAGTILASATPLVADVATATNSLGHVLNRVEVRDPASKNPILVPAGANQGALVYGLIHTFSDSVEGAAIAADGSENLSISMVYTDASGTTTPFTYSGPVEFNLNLAFQKRHMPAVSISGQGAVPQDEIGGVDIEQADFEVTAAFHSAEVLTVSTGAGSVAGASSVTIQPVGEDVALPSDFDTNVNCVAELNGIRLKKGSQISYLSSDTLTINFVMDIDDTLTIRVPRN